MRKNVTVIAKMHPNDAHFVPAIRDRWFKVTITHPNGMFIWDDESVACYGESAGLWRTKGKKGPSPELTFHRIILTKTGLKRLRRYHAHRKS